MKRINLIKSVSIALKNIRIQKGMSQEKLSKKSGIDRAYISRLENGTENLTLKQIQRIAKALDAEIKITIT